MANSVKLQDFIKSVSEEVLQSQKDGKFELLTPIDFEVTVSVKKVGKGGIDIVVVGAGGKYEKEETSTIKFSMGNPASVEQLEKMTKLWQISSNIHNENLRFAIESLKP